MFRKCPINWFDQMLVIEFNKKKRGDCFYDAQFSFGRKQLHNKNWILVLIAGTTLFAYLKRDQLLQMKEKEKVKMINAKLGGTLLLININKPFVAFE